MKKIIIAILLITTGFGCSNLDLAPLDARSELTFWKTDEDANIFLNSMYADIWNADAYLYFNALSDDAYTRREDYRNIGNGNYDASNGVVTGAWSSRYEGIRRANIFMNNIDNVEDISESNRESYKAQARFIRALHYFYLVELYGDVPLVIDEISIDESLQLVRTDKSIVTDFIYTELATAINNLPETDEPGRITKDAGIAFKSKVHLYNEDYQSTVNLAGELIGEYSLFPDYEGLFQPQNENNDEIILSLQYIPIDREHNNQYSLIPPSQSGYANFSPLQELVDSYLTIDGKEITDASSGYDENNPYVNRDPRLEATILYNGHSWTDFDGSQITIDTSPGAEPNGYNYSSNTTQTGYYVAKYFDINARNQTNSGLDLILIRYAEVLLNYAEAKNELGSFTEQDWDMTIKLIRERAGLIGSALDFPGGGQASLRTIIRNERRVELAFEAGHRFFDIRRWRLSETVNSGWLHGFKTDESLEDDGYIRVDFRTFDPAKDYLWPIPQSERDLNKNLTQNPNW
ncbi:RagB/SusD family nutrient uptake outer membrane protein [Flavivirga sp. 57AJ16]|uniref:RagB/SusD family nutrient uptake outer membrane protein n=1 Tax=Flavivirga sp. 57AJ16 TaxID=3025307 RepID=UPI002366DB80|nr:RagB/SusD family nutrient uptake outer membrane protein [Flavivirga sp. 57AJ16]MDD7884501.1 RagB/SusD family nutrient uptake outer membrane protein [Flavivirga sp. 57AJ16]